MTDQSPTAAAADRPLHHAVRHVLRYFKHDHLPAGPLRETSRACHDLAWQMARELPPSREVTVGLRKLLEAKDAFVRAALEAPAPPAPVLGAPEAGSRHTTADAPTPLQVRPRSQVLLERHLEAAPPGEAPFLQQARMAVDAEHLTKASEWTLTLGELIDGLEGAPARAQVVFTAPGTPMDAAWPDLQLVRPIDSWRGVYHDLALAWTDREGSPVVYVEELLAVLRRTPGTVFHGYKGGDYTAALETPVWVDNWGQWSEMGIRVLRCYDDSAGRAVVQIVAHSVVN